MRYTSDRQMNYHLYRNYSSSLAHGVSGVCNHVPVEIEP